jgi:hypothetical protein
MEADRFTVGGEVRDEAGLHAVWRIPRAVPVGPGEAVMHCLAWGRVRVGDLGLRAEKMEVQEIVLHPDAPDELLDSVRQRYPACRVRRAQERRKMLVLKDDGTHGTVVNGTTRHGRWVFFDGSTGRYRYGLQHGIWRHPDGSQETYFEGIRHGRWKWPSGLVGEYRYGKEHGVWLWPDGRAEIYVCGEMMDVIPPPPSFDSGRPSPSSGDNIPPGMKGEDGRTLCTRVFLVQRDGTLSPTIYDDDYVIVGNRVTVAERSGKSKKGGVSYCGPRLRACWYLPSSVPTREEGDKDGQEMAVTHCLTSGRVRLEGDFFLRAEELEIREIVLRPEAPDELLEAVRGRYPDCQVRRARKRKRFLAMACSLSFGAVCDGKLHGSWVEDFGEIYGRYRRGFRQGRWIWSRRGVVGHYRDGEWHGRWYDPEGQSSYNGGKRHGLWVSFGGSVERYRNGFPHGRWVSCTGRVECYRNGLRHGRMESYPGGPVESYRNGLRHGRWTTRGGVSVCYRQGERHGRWVYPDGRSELYRMGKLVRIELPIVGE